MKSVFLCILKFKLYSEDSETFIPGKKGWLNFRILAPLSPHLLELVSPLWLCVCVCVFLSFLILGPHPKHMEVPMLGV